jgi:hypothetical protein
MLELLKSLSDQDIYYANHLAPAIRTVLQAPSGGFSLRIKLEFVLAQANRTVI